MYETVDQVMAWMKDEFTKHPELQFEYVDYGDPDDIIPGFPAIIITNNPTVRRLGGTHTFNIELSVDLWVLHANGNASTAQRRMEDIQLCNQIQAFLDLNMRLDNNIIQGWVSGQSPGLLARRGTLIVATRMTWDGVTQSRFTLQP